MSMKTLPFVRHLRERVVGRASPKPLRFCEVTTSEEKAHPLPEVIVRVEARVFYEEVCADTLLGAKGADSDHFKSGLQERAVRSIAFELYGPIEQEIRRVLKLLWEDGLHNSDAARRLDALIPMLRGE